VQKLIKLGKYPILLEILKKENTKEKQSIGGNVMEKWVEKPRSFGEILDLTFLVLKKQFAKIFLIMLILTGPILLVQAMAMYSGGMPLLPGHAGADISSLDQFLLSLESSGIDQALVSVGGIELAILIITLVLLIIILLPVALAAIMIVTEKVKNGESVEIKPIIKQSFSRFGALLGGSIVYLLIAFGLILVPSLGFSFLFAFGEPNVGPLLIIVSVVVGLAYLFGVVYLLTRWGFYFPAIVFEKVSPGIGKSWRLTKGQFWRLVGLYIVLNIIVSIITFALQIVSDFLLAGSIFGYLFDTLFTALSYLIMNIAYAVIYFDLRVRNEGADLQEMLDSYSSPEDVKLAEDVMVDDVQFEHEKVDNDHSLDSKEIEK
jgi:hypothetical protein